ncbi:MAG: alpha/beta-type small acid-soluble spore protein [Firmicutes bacterium]|nr:alpha/beta-type small acid-soluble spore protein [Bacillota bacterium]
MTNNRSRKKIIVPEARQALNEMKNEIANELGIIANQSTDKYNLTSRENGHIGGSLGGNMTKRLIEQAQRQLIDTGDFNK